MTDDERRGYWMCVWAHKKPDLHLLCWDSARHGPCSLSCESDDIAEWLQRVLRQAGNSNVKVIHRIDTTGLLQETSHEVP